MSAPYLLCLLLLTLEVREHTVQALPSQQAGRLPSLCILTVASVQQIACIAGLLYWRASPNSPADARHVRHMSVQTFSEGCLTYKCTAGLQRELATVSMHEGEPHVQGC